MAPLLVVRVADRHPLRPCSGARARAGGELHGFERLHQRHAQSLTGTQTGTIAAGGTLSTTASSVTLGIATGTGEVLTNAGTISSGNRAIDYHLTRPRGCSPSPTAARSAPATTASASTAPSPRHAAAHQLRYHRSLPPGGQALDFDKATATSAVVTINNSGLIRPTARMRCASRRRHPAPSPIRAPSPPRLRARGDQVRHRLERGHARLAQHHQCGWAA